MVVRNLVTALIASAGVFAFAPAASAELVLVRVIGDNVMVKSRPSRQADTLSTPPADSVLEVLSKEGSWFWVLVARDSHGTQRVGWVRESQVEFIDSALARFFTPSTPIPINDPAAAELTAEATPGEEAGRAATDAPVTVESNLPAEVRLQAEEKLPREAAKAEKVAKVEKPKKVDDRKLKKAAQEYEKALQAYEKLQFSALSADQPLLPVGEPIIEPLYSLPD